MRGLPESTLKFERERYEHKMRKVFKTLAFLSIECKIKEIKRIGPYQEGQARTIAVSVAKKFPRRQILLSFSKLKKSGKLEFVSRELNAEKARHNFSLLEKRRVRIQSGTLGNELKICDLKLYKKIGKE